MDAAIEFLEISYNQVSFNSTLIFVALVLNFVRFVPYVPSIVPYVPKPLSVTKKAKSTKKKWTVIPSLPFNV